MEKWVCDLCGYVYDPEKGSEGFPPGTPFEELPEDWECPECLAGMDQFSLEYLSRKKTPRS
ncbi:MAG: rubredoxin [Peptococcaceae bacterium BICA1-7]|nr:MAG: rubredoxin [Peptococcaceae bacterium BICA1-7]HBV98305.1 rubredoxin [Desulfotomaculum sp.]